MPPRRLRTLVTGLGLFIIGPAIGFCAYLIILLQALPGGTRPSLAEALAEWQQLPGQIALALIPLALGLLSGAVGLFMVVASIALHYFGGGAANPTAPELQPTHASRTQIPKSTQTPRKAAAPVADDSRFMPKFQ